MGDPYSRRGGARDLPEQHSPLHTLLSEAVQEHTAGRLEAAKLLYLQILGMDIRHDRSLFGLGVIAYQVGSFDVAEKMLRRAIAVNSSDPQYHSSLGLALQALKRRDDALLEFQYVLKRRPDDAQAHFNVATLLLEAQRLDEAKTFFESAIARNPNYADAHNNLGNVFLMSGKLEEARRCYGRALDLQPDSAKAHNNLGNVLREQGKLDEAKCHYERALAIAGNSPDVLTNLGNVYISQRNLEEAEAHFNLALSLDPSYIEAHNSQGVAYQKQGRYEEARICHQRALDLNPDSADTLNSLGVALYELRSYPDSQTCLERAVSLRPDWAEVHNNLGVTFRAQGMFENAASSYRSALALRPSYAAAHSNLGLAFQNQGELGEAIKCYDRALGFDPGYVGARWNKALLELLLGDFENGWKDFEARHTIQRLAPRSFSEPLWLGRPLNGACILLHAEQGLGDAIQFLRYVPLVQAAGGTVVLLVPRPLLRLSESIRGVAQVATEVETLPLFECHCPLMSLPLACGTNFSSIPNSVPYLSVPEPARSSVDPIRWDAGKLHVGLVWSGNPAHGEDHLRSILLTRLAPLFNLSGLQFISLQAGAAAAQLSSSEYPVIGLPANIEDMADTAALIERLDLVVTVDTAVAHLAAALGKPTWVLIPFAPDWRWLIDRDENPWYPTMRLFRQPRLRDWESVIERVRDELQAMAARTGTI